jgi:recombination protein RecA
MAKNLNNVLDDLKKKYAKAFADVNQQGVIHYTRLDSPQMNWVFGGRGLPRGRVIELFGPESSGKSTISTYLAIQNQKYNTERPLVVYIDLERTFDRDHAIELGLNCEEPNLIFLQPLTGEEGFEICKTLIQEMPVGLIVWDSIGATPSASQVDDAFKATFGSTAHVLSDGLKMLNPYLSKYDTTLIFINQERALIGGFSPVPGATSTPGGFARKFYASWRGRVTRIETLKDHGDPIGIKMKIRNVKNKAGMPFREAVVDLNFKTGFNADNEYLDFIVALLCKRAGAWYNNEEWGMHVQGVSGVEAFLKDHPDIYTKAKEAVNKQMEGSTVLDDTDADKKSEDELEKATEEEKAWAKYDSEAAGIEEI